MRQDDAARFAGGSRRVGDGEGIPLFDQREGRAGTGLVQQVLIGRADDDDPLDGGAVGGAQQGLERGGDEDDPGAAIVEDVAEFGRGLLRVGGGDRDPRLGQTIDDLDVFQAVGGHDGRPVALPQPEPGRQRRDPVDAVDQLRVGEPALAADDRHLAGRAGQVGADAGRHGHGPVCARQGGGTHAIRRLWQRRRFPASGRRGARCRASASAWSAGGASVRRSP